jgi:hypothetical protein
MWIAFFGVATGVFLFSFNSVFVFQAGALLFYLGGIAILYFTLIPLKRVEGSPEHIYITNYFKTFRYTFESLSRIRTLDLLLVKIIVVHFRDKTSFGKMIYFIRRKGVWEEYLLSHPELAEICDK